MTGNLQQEGICTAEWDTHVLAYSNHECGVSEIVNKIERTNSTAGELKNVGRANRENAETIKSVITRFTE